MDFTVANIILNIHGGYLANYNNNPHEHFCC